VRIGTMAAGGEACFSMARGNSAGKLRRSARGLPFLGVLSTLGLVAGCQTIQTTEPGTVGVERKQRMLISGEAIEQGAERAYAAELTKAQAAGTLNPDTAQVARVRRIADRVIRATTTFRPDAQTWRWQVNVLRSRDLNAYCMPGGRIMVYSGLIERLELTDAELATVVAHEVAHALREHTRERVSRAYGQQLILVGAAVVGGASSQALDLANMVADVTFTLPFSREQESEADEIGLELQARAAFEPRAAVSLWNKMSRADGGVPTFLSTHPSRKSRIKDIEALLPRVEPLYKPDPSR
jgi:predicted Zn-dependent protease